MKKLYIDQYGNKFYADTIKELRAQIGNGGSRVSKMYEEFNGISYHVGYVIGRHWMYAYNPMMKPT